ncbi:MAG: cob(I)yrinic acid a,c-diamide adenosyltransferase [Burkholderiaceae bacterium]|nr:cob(I)yrinic acid a,c-diamide adenosyltransferase [Burkholderiaceae bacterium]
MGHRLSAITTRTGDDGSTGLGDGTRVGKDTARIQAMGDVDELNSCLGVLLAEPLAEPVAQALAPVQHALFDLGSELAIPGYAQMTPDQLARLDALIAAFNAPLGPLGEFILPGGTRAAALAHVARSVCRRAERSVVTVAHESALGTLPQQYLNRLSDLLFILARTLNKESGTPDTLWKRG